MMQNTALMDTTELTQSGWVARAVMGSAGKSARYFVALMRHAAARERSRRELAQLDARMLRDIGLEPFDRYYGWQSSSR